MTSLIKGHEKISFSSASASNYVFLKISKYSQENTCTGVTFYLRCWPEGFSCEICEIFKNIFFHRLPMVAAAVIFKYMTLYSVFRDYLNF